jgi:mono/diheme cytochrome c family protein
LKTYRALSNAVRFTLSGFLLLGCKPSAPAEDEGPTWTRDVQPIVEQHCVRCHNADGTGVGDFQNFSTVSAFAEVMLEKIDSGEMPPPASDPACRDYVDSEVLFLDAEKRDIIAAWIEAEKPEGDPADTQTYDTQLYTLDEANFELRIPEPYTATFTDSSDPGNEYQCFALEHGQTEAFYISAIHPLVDNQKMAHHVILGTAKAKALIPGSETNAGASCIANGGAFANGESAMLGGWAPGMQPMRLPDGVGIRVEPDDYLVIQMHYFQGDLTEDERTDRPGVAMVISDAVDEEVYMWTFGTQDFVIPAGAESHSAGDSFTLPNVGEYSINVWSMLPHMHAIGSGFAMSVETDSGEECVVQSDGYDFDNQQNYLFKEPLSVRNGDKVSWTCTWNNSESNPDLIYNPPIDIRYGEGSEDEMCFFFGLISE